MKKNNLPTIQELTSLSIEKYEKENDLMVLLNQNPPEKWVKTHPFIKNHRYLPIDKVEHLLKNIFHDYNIEVLREGTSFNGVYVVCRVHYRDVLSGVMKFHDGIGACELQTKKGASVADLSSINNGAISMAFPIAKTLAVKDACDHFGSLFGANLNRKDVIPFKKAEKIDHDKERMMVLITGAETIEDIEYAESVITDETLIPALKAKKIQILKTQEK